MTPLGALQLLAFAVIALEFLDRTATLASRWLSIVETKYAGEYEIARDRLLDRETPPKPEQLSKREIVVPPEIANQLADAPDWEREQTYARAVELYEELERKFPDDKPADRWGRVHKLLELETEVVQASV
jgi:hypothetical protein